MSDQDDIKKPLDHLPPAEDRDPDMEIDEPHYPDTGKPDAGSSVSPETAADPRLGDADRHDFDTRPPS